MPEWTLISNHGLVLVCIARHPQSTAKEIAAAVRVTEWTVHRIISDMVKEGYVGRQRSGRKNVYHIEPSARLRHTTVSGITVGDFLKALDGRERDERTG